ncbi:RagB/SusD family nutrient uptake outer membrane protein [Spirosoma oryzicola]|uniref:RagB/SusD family nutrient uptake outer membrane protein n=1 Tax=Spirosoma oryzicola TaxID=2898794 RepID=UPI001E58C04E|nr:RagB/SusD family nutrient uptake outer membrane protein [Spirosoma oryzicola]UHG89770.1 RagB/SusD family nutrient uptake outer membrane protein [Spirosoma oryzicola]
MKSIIKPAFLALAMMAVLPSCEVERLPETSVSDETYWRTESDLKTAANYLYMYLPGFGTFTPPGYNSTFNVTYGTEDVWSDDAFGLATNNISDGSRLAPATATDYNTNYLLIRAANNVIEKAPRASAATSATIIDRYIAEARFFRAWGYYALVQRYGDVPLILKTLDDTSAELQAPATPRAQIYDQIYQDLDYAAQKLPTATALGTADYGRISNTAALAFKARVALFEGTRSKYHNYGEPTKHLKLAVDAAKAVIDSKQQDLFSGSYFDLFQLAGEGRQNRENIIVKQYGVSSTDRVATQNFFRSSLETGNMNPTKSLTDSYLMKDGLPTAKSPLYKAPTKSTDVFVNRDTRMSDTFFKTGDAWIGTKLVFDIAPLVFNRTGFTFRKYSNLDDWVTTQSLIDRVLLRYAEVLLTYAEATYELNGTISDVDLDLTINRLRARGGVAKLTNAFATANGLTVRDEIRRERRVELAQEGFRYWDLIRWKTAEIELPKPVLGNYFFRTEYGTTTAVNLTSDNYILVQDASFRKFDPNRDYLWPLPINEIALNPTLKQNPGW